MQKKNLRKFKYVAIDVDNKKSSGVLLAENVAQLRKMLVEANLFLVSYKAVGEKFIAQKNGEIPHFAREFAILISAGIPIAEALETLKEQAYSSKLSNILGVVHDDVRSGILLSDAMNKHKQLFPELFTSMIRVGEISGSLDAILEELAVYYEREEKIRRKAQSALIYPTILAALTFFMIVLLFSVIVPTFKNTFERLDIPLPALTRLVLSISAFFERNWLWMLIALIVIVFAVVFAFRFEKVKYCWDALKAKLPIIRTVTSSLVASRFARGFGTLVSSGVDVARALEIMSKLIGNKFYQKQYDAACAEIKEGRPIADALSARKVFPELLIKMIAVGEKTGSLDNVMNKTTAHFDAKVETSLIRMTSLLEPIIICILGAIVALIMLSVFTPLLSIITTLGE